MEKCAAATSRGFAAAAEKLLNTLGYHSERKAAVSRSVADFMSKYPAAETQSAKQFRAAVADVNIVFQLAQGEIEESIRRGDIQPDLALSSTSTPFQKRKVESFLFVAADLRPGHYSRSNYADFVREINKRFNAPTVALFRRPESENNATLTLAFVNRRQSKIRRNYDVLKKVSLLREIQCDEPHPGHLQILAELSLANRLEWIDNNDKSRDFDGLLAAWLDELDSEALNRRFYKDLLEWFQRIIDPEGAVVFPSPEEAPTPPAQHAIRLISRILFIWFLKERQLVDKKLLSQSAVTHLLKPGADDSYYRAILQNLFFATLNTRIEKRGFRKDGSDKKRYNPEHGVFGLYRYEDLIKDKKEFKRLMAKTPFVNGGLFDCLDVSAHEKEGQKVSGWRIDCFTDNRSQRDLLRIPNALFFDDDSKGTPGLFTILGKYKFTVQENTPVEQEVALDPELLGNVFEKLLGFINHGKTDADRTPRSVMKRGEVGAYYTPRSIVDYMTRESLVRYFAGRMTPPKSKSSNDLQYRLRLLLSPEINYDTLSQRYKLCGGEVIEFIDLVIKMRLLDPAVGSGAFPMGALTLLTMAFKRVDPENSVLREREIEYAQGFETKSVRDNSIEFIRQAFSKENLHNDYGRKLSLIRDNIFGTDILPEAVQICRLRFFISLAIEQATNNNPKDNFGIRALPNLEARMIAADALLKIKSASVFRGAKVIKDLEQKLETIRRDFFNATTREAKKRCRKADGEKRAELAAVLRDRNYPPDDAGLIADWDLYDQNTVANWFDPEWMFNVKDGFDVVIGNPPYVKVEHFSSERKRTLKDAFGWCDDLYAHFIIRGAEFVKKGGVFCYIANDSFVGFSTKERVRDLLLRNRLLSLIKCPGETFDATIYTAIFMAEMATPPPDSHYESGEFVYPDYTCKMLGKVAYKMVDKMYARRLLYNDPMLDLYQKLRDRHKTVGAFLAVLDAGIHSGNVRSKIFFAKKGKKNLSRMLQGRQINRYLLNWDSSDAQYKFCDINYVPADTLGVGRGGATSRLKEYWTMKHGVDYHHQPERLLMRQTSDHLVVAYHGEKQSGQFYTDNTLFTILAKSEKVNLKYAMAIFNSKVMVALYRFVAQEGGKALAQVKTGLVESLPFVVAANQEKIVQLAEKITAAKAADPDADTREMEDKIDALVYKLYGLTAPADIALIEEWQATRHRR